MSITRRSQLDNSDALDEAAIPAVSASGNRWRLRTRTRCAKIGSDQCEVTFCIRGHAPSSCGRRGDAARK
jgi:hypothetical protein